jgi:hypothetical protein
MTQSIFQQARPTLQGVEVPGQSSRVEGITRLVNEDALGQGELTSLLRFRQHGHPMSPDNVDRPAIQMKHAPARPALGIAFHHRMTGGRPRRPHRQDRWIPI